MRDKDSKLIFENYLTSKSDVVLEADEKEKSGLEQTKDWLIYIGKVLDPTGISSYPDLVRAAIAYNSDKSIENFGLLVLNGFAALPNLGLLAAGVGGIGWAALKAAAKTAIKSGGADAAPIATKVLKTIQSSKELQYAFDKIINSLLKNGALDKSGANSIRAAIKQGGVSTTALGVGVEKGLSQTGKSNFKQATKEMIKDRPILGKTAQKGMAGMAQLGVRASDVEDTSVLQYPSFLPTHFSGKDDKKTTGPTKEAAAKGKYPVGTWTPRKKTEPTSQKEQKPPQEKPKTKSKFDYENL